MDLNTIWFLLLGILLLGYGILDGFDLGVGVLHLFAKDERERRIHMNAIGPVWDGNEVWLLTAGGAMFAAFPPVYATVFSGFYLAFMLLLLALIFRAVSMEFRGKVDSAAWKRIWDWGFGLGSLVPPLLYGVALGNVMAGLPLDAGGNFTGSFYSLLSPYALLVGVTSLAFFIMHGAAWMMLKTEGGLQARMRNWVTRSWAAFVLLYTGATFMSVFSAPHLFEGLVEKPLFWVAISVLVAAVALIPLAAARTRVVHTFLLSAAALAAMLALVGLSLYPNLVPAIPGSGESLTIYNASSTPRTLKVMLIIAAAGMPFVVGYTALIYRAFRGKVTITEESY